MKIIDTMQMYFIAAAIEDGKIVVDWDRMVKYLAEGFKKQTPMKPAIYDNTGLEEYAECKCGAILLTTYGVRHKYCRECGQKIDWSKEE